MEEIQLYLDEAKSLMDKSIQHTVAELVKIRAGKAMPNFLDGIMVSYYGNPTPLQQVASVTTPDARTLAIKPWEPKLIPEIEKAIINSDLRTIRKDTNDALKKLLKDGAAEDEVKRAEDIVQKMTDSHSIKIDELFSKKEVEIMKV